MGGLQLPHSKGRRLRGQVFLAQVLQFQCQLHKCLGEQGTPTDAGPCAEERALAMELQRRADRALLNTYLTIEEIMMHRDRRVELWQAQARVTELYLRNLERRLEMLRKRANNFSPYSEDPEAPMIDPGLMEDLNETEATIVKHNLNLEKYKEEEELIRERFAGDIERFKTLKGLE